MTRKDAAIETDRGPTHDSSYKLLYSHTAMVSDLLRGFIPGAWIHELDLTTLEKCSDNYVSDDLRNRADDLIWRVRWGRDWLYVYLLLERGRMGRGAPMNLGCANNLNRAETHHLHLPVWPIIVSVRHSPRRPSRS